MPRIFDLEVSSARLALRVVAAVILAGLTFVVFYYIPSHFEGLVSGALPASGRSALQGLVSSVVSPSIPDLGLLLTALVFFGVILNGSRAYGVVLIFEGALFAAYTYILLHGGTLSVTLPGGLPNATTGTITFAVPVLMLIFLVPSLLTIVKGAAVLAIRPQSTRSSAP
jgi:hypothetical protein